jgi:predicted permease
VKSLSGVEEPLISNSDRGANVTVEGEPPELAGTRHVQLNPIGPGHFTNLRIPLRQGREFTRQDTSASPKVAIINEAMANEFFPNRQALGKRMKFGGASSPLDMEIIGIVRNSRHSDLQELPKSFVYVPYAQMKFVRSLTYYVRTSQDPTLLASAVRSAVSDLDSSLPVYDVRTFEEQINRRLSPNKLVAFLALTFGALAGVLAAMGIYGLLAYSVTQRTREMGVRIALGAEPNRVGWMVIGDVARLTGLGILAGLPLAYASSKFINSMLYGVRAFGAASVAIALVVLLIVSAIAAYVPVRRATRIDPMTALRYE